ncbi:GDP-fucose protein O-fucosyltransferase domain-containing protein [Colletotrichum incanum]|nr:GDP-fucose protein O-fucosyltransferase domain-containing protein [Colletotrichum incanum]
MGVLVRYPKRRPGRFFATAGAIILFITWALRVRFEQVDPNMQVQVTTWRSSPRIEDYFDHPSFDSEAIRSVCEDQKWDANTDTEVVFTCDNSVGELGEIRNSILNCVRYTILAGGSLVMPRIVVLKNSDRTVRRTGESRLKSIGERKGLEYMFDINHFIESLHLSCPQLRLYNDIEEVYETLGPSRTWVLGLFPESLIEEEKIPSTGIQHPDRWRSQLYDWLGQIDTDVSPIGRHSQGPFIVDLGRSYLTFPIYSDGEPFATAFGNILKFRPDARKLATIILLRMAKKFGFELIESRDGAGPSNTDPYASTTLEQAYFGVHLPVQKDSQGMLDPSGNNKQTTAYLEQAVGANLSIIYVASGDAKQVEAFKKKAMLKGIAIVTKHDLLEDDDQLENLDWDQQALVDFLVLLSASQFGGVAPSSFSWNVALKRHLFIGKSKEKHLDGALVFNDELSQIYGEPRSYPEFAACLWP